MTLVVNCMIADLPVSIGVGVSGQLESVSLKMFW